MGGDTLALNRAQASATASRYAAKVAVPRPLPNLTLIIHGVNDAGVTYEAQEQGLCEGLNERLNRSGSEYRGGGDLRPASYNTRYAATLAELEQRDPAKARQLRSQPDLVLFRRAADASVYSPVIPFYWGFREQEGRDPESGRPYVNKTEWHGEWLDRYGNRLDKNGTKEGGPFANATSNLPQMWEDGLDGRIEAWLADKANGDPLRPMRRTPNRRYMVLAAMRLARLIEMIRKKPETQSSAVNIVAHSQGCLISLLAQALCQPWGIAPADTLILQNPPYALGEEIKGGDESTQARLKTLQSIVAFVHGSAAGAPALSDLAAPAKGQGVVGQYWRGGPGSRKVVAGETGGLTFAERDNRGKVYLYFSPADQTVQLFNVRGIGWQGVPDCVRAVTGIATILTADPMGVTVPQSVPIYSDLPALSALAPIGFRQRVFTRLMRDADLVLVGDVKRCDRYHELRIEGEYREGAGVLRPDSKVGERRLINGEALNPPCRFHMGARQLDVDAIDASIGMSSGRLGRRTLVDEVPDPRPPDQRGQDFYPQWHADAMRSQLQKTYDEQARATGYPAENRKELRWVEVDGRRQVLRVHRYESPNEMRERLMGLGAVDNPNSYHSSIPAHSEHHRLVTAYDVSLGAPVPPELHVNGWLDYLRAVADWRTDWKKLARTSTAIGPTDPEARACAIKVLKWKSAESCREAGDLCDDTFRYFISGQMPGQVNRLPTLDLVQTQSTTLSGLTHGMRKFAPPQT